MIRPCGHCGSTLHYDWQCDHRREVAAAIGISLIAGCPTCGARSDSHPVVGEHDGGRIRLCPCGGAIAYDSGVLGGIEIQASLERVELLRQRREELRP